MGNGKEEKDDKFNEALEAALATIREKIELLKQSLLKSQSISFSLWSNILRTYLKMAIVGSEMPELVELAKALLEAQVDFETEKQKEIYQKACNIIREVNALDDFGSIGGTSFIR